MPIGQSINETRRFIIKYELFFNVTVTLNQVQFIKLGWTSLFYFYYYDMNIIEKEISVPLRLFIHLIKNTCKSSTVVQT